MELPSHHYDDAVLVAPKGQEAYFRFYREAHPSERFDILTLERLEKMFQYELADGTDDALLQAGVSTDELEVTKEVIRRLRFAPDSPALNRYRILEHLLETDGLLRQISDPFAYFKGRKIIVRGYYDGRGIAEAMQDLPNICVNFDFGTEPLREQAPEVVSFQEGLALLQGAPKPVYLLASKDEPIPEELQGMPRLDDPHAPSEGSFIIYETGKPLFVPNAPDLDEALLKAIRIPTLPEASRRLSVETKYLLLSPRLYARLGKK